MIIVMETAYSLDILPLCEPGAGASLGFLSCRLYREVTEARLLSLDATGLKIIVSNNMRDFRLKSIAYNIRAPSLIVRFVYFADAPFL